MTTYVDTSAAGKLLIEEAESSVLRAYFDALVSNNVRIVSSFLLETELRRIAVRHGLSQAGASAVLDRFELLDPDRAVFAEAGLLPGANLRSLDALHIATAIRVEADAVVTYDVRMADAARGVGLRVVAPCVEAGVP